MSLNENKMVLELKEKTFSRTSKEDQMELPLDETELDNCDHEQLSQSIEFVDIESDGHVDTIGSDIDTLSLSSDISLESTGSVKHKDAKDDEEEEPKLGVKGVIKVVCSFLIFLLVGFGMLGAILYLDAKGDKVKVIEITKAPVTDCVKYSQTFQDTVCDDKLNTEECMYDGGDCCLEEKTTSYCMNCSCIVSVNESEIENYMATRDLAIYSVDLPLPETSRGYLNEKTLKTIENVLGWRVCFVLCTDFLGQEDLDQRLWKAWRYVKRMTVNNVDLFDCHCLSFDIFDFGVGMMKINTTMLDIELHEFNEVFFAEYLLVEVPDTCGIPENVGDGNCDALLNTEECLFDRGDCCRLNATCTFCDLCLCKENSTEYPTPCS